MKVIDNTNNQKEELQVGDIVVKYREDLPKVRALIGIVIDEVWNIKTSEYEGLTIFIIYAPGPFEDNLNGKILYKNTDKSWARLPKTESLIIQND